MDTVGLWKRRLSKAAVYYVGYSDDTGRRRWKSLGVSTKAEAQKQLTRFKEILSQTGRRASPSLSQFSKEFEQYAKGTYAPQSCYLFTLTLRSLRECVGDIALSKVTPRDVDKWLTLRLSQVKPVSANVQLRTLRSAFSTALRWNLLPTNPAKAVTLPRVSGEPASFLTRAELALLLQHLPAYVRPIVRLGFHTGMRRGELLSLRWSQVDFCRGIVHVHSSTTFKVKAGSDRVVPLNSEARAVLLALDQTQELVFHRDGRPVLGNHITKLFREAVRDAKLDHRLHFHSLRHSFCSNLAAQGVSLYQIGALAGHK